MASPLCDAHCHFFSSRFLEILTVDRHDLPAQGRADAVSALLEWDAPGSAQALAERWIAELDRCGVSRAALIASAPGDEDSVATAVAAFPSRVVGFFMFNPSAPDPRARLHRAFSMLGLRGVCLFPAMHGYRLDDERVRGVFEAAEEYGAAVFAHCGVLSVGVRKKLGLPSLFDFRLGEPLALAAASSRFPSVPVIVPHFGAGFFREALMTADQCANVHLDTSSSNAWMKYSPALTLDAVFRQSLAVLGPSRLLFGTDSSFFPRGWQQTVYDAQRSALDAAGASEAAQSQIFGGNFNRLFPAPDATTPNSP
ncbi:MAG: amidohydrolase [Acidobacteria bacterium]|nr:amidohydrolase [Acidobacteriota bacterium]MCA1650722.1 amidohydrolase [Acidobacteriota bacterium]